MYAYKRKKPGLEADGSGNWTFKNVQKLLSTMSNKGFITKYFGHDCSQLINKLFKSLWCRIFCYNLHQVKTVPLADKKKSYWST